MKQFPRGWIGEWKKKKEKERERGRAKENTRLWKSCGRRRPGLKGKGGGKGEQKRKPLFLRTLSVKLHGAFIRERFNSLEGETEREASPRWFLVAKLLTFDEIPLNSTTVCQKQCDASFPLGETRLCPLNSAEKSVIYETITKDISCVAIQVTWVQQPSKDSFRLLTFGRIPYSVDQRISLNFRWVKLTK